MECEDPDNYISLLPFFISKIVVCTIFNCQTLKRKNHSQFRNSKEEYIKYRIFKSDILLYSYLKYQETMKNIVSQNQYLIHPDIQCRFCYDNTLPLISICDCTGTVEFIHQYCLAQWIKSRHLYQSQSPLSCQICKAKYSSKTKIFTYQQKWTNVVIEEFIKLKPSRKIKVVTYLLEVFVLLLHLIKILEIYISTESNLQNAWILTLIFMVSVYRNYRLFKKYKRLLKQKKTTMRIVEITIKPKKIVQQWGNDF